MNLNDETIRKIMAETVSRSLDQSIFKSLMGNAHTSPGFTWRKEYVADYTIPKGDRETLAPADSLVIEGECREVGLKGLPADAVKHL